jgi:hypothetical protein
LLAILLAINPTVKPLGNWFAKGKVIQAAAKALGVWIE